MFPFMTFRGFISEVVGVLYFFTGPAAAETQSAISDDDSVGQSGEVYWVPVEGGGQGRGRLDPEASIRDWRQKFWVVVVRVFTVISCLCV